ncbi:MAG: nitrite/sulfite reductase [Motiliproteus sp.]|nr:nitrite/sulfite reductase [Motiliproteus sp.]MCW9052714.1 nitrite/sulfite reductase [Motiliproteus sp.]
MYLYNEREQQLIEQRVEQYRDQTRRYLAGEIPDEEFRILRLQNGLYIQRQAPMLRIAINYGLLSSRQMRALAQVSRDYDKNYAHFTTRQNVQLNWPELEKVPDILADLAKVQMHAIQTSGSCIRSVTSDHFAGIVAGEVEDPRPWSEIIRQWAALHPEFAYLPRKFKIAVSAAEEDRAATQVHDIGVHIVRNDQGEVGFEVLVGGGLGRTPVIGKQIRPFLEQQELLSYLEAILRVYNLHGRRDNKYKSRIKITVNAMGIDKFRELVEAEFERTRGGELRLPEAEIERVKAFFKAPDYEQFDGDDASYLSELEQDKDFAIWVERNSFAHKVPGYRAVTLALKALLKAPGDITDVQMDAVADLADKYSFGEVRSTHEQNLVLAHVKQSDLYSLWKALSELELARPVVGTLNDMICCPGLDFCSLANAETLGVAEQIQNRFDDLDYLYDLGEMKLKMSGCINACAHHHVGHIGILGVDKNGESYYQFTLGGSAAEDASLGKVLGKSIPKEQVAEMLEKILSVFVEQREEGERFIDTVRRVGNVPFKERVYATNH